MEGETEREGGKEEGERRDLLFVCNEKQKIEKSSGEGCRDSIPEED